MILLGLYFFRKIQYANQLIGKIIFIFYSSTLELDKLLAIIANISYDNYYNTSKWLKLGMRKF